MSRVWLSCLCMLVYLLWGCIVCLACVRYQGWVQYLASKISLGFLANLPFVVEVFVMSLRTSGKGDPFLSSPPTVLIDLLTFSLSTTHLCQRSRWMSGVAAQRSLRSQVSSRETRNVTHTWLSLQRKRCLSCAQKAGRGEIGSLWCAAKTTLYSLQTPPGSLSIYRSYSYVR